MAFGIYGVIRKAVSQGVNKPSIQLTSDASDFVNAKSHAREKPLLTG